MVRRAIQCYTYRVARYPISLGLTLVLPRETELGGQLETSLSRFPWGQDQVLWERVDKSKPIGFTDGGGIRWLSFYPEAERGRGGPGPCEPGGCLHNYTASDEFKKEMKGKQDRFGLNFGSTTP